MSNAQAASTTALLDDKTVTLSLNAEGFAVPNQDPIFVERNQQKIKWSAPFEFEIHINDYENTVTKYRNGSGTWESKTDVFPGKRYKYSIVANGKTNDPEIVVQP